MAVRNLLLSLLGVGIAACGTAPLERAHTRGGGGHAAVVVEITRAEDQWLTAIQAADFVALERLMAPEFVLASGRPGRTTTLDRAGWFTNSRARPEALREMEGRFLRVAAADDDVAVAEVELRWLGRLYFASDTWVRRSGQWEVVYRHTSPARDSSVHEPDRP